MCEVVLEPFQFCNLSSVVCKHNDTVTSLIHKTKLAVIVGGIQSLATNFPNLRPIWKEITEKDRLLGVNHIGHANCTVLRNKDVQVLLKQVSEDVDLWFSKEMNVVRSAAILSVKPSGNSSVLYDVGPGINPEHERYSLRNVTVNKGTAMYNFLYSNGVPYFEYNGKSEKVLFSFPQHKPNGIVLDETTAIEQLEYWKQVKVNMLHHTASTSIIYEPHEVNAIIQWLYENQNIISGLSFFPKFDSSHPHLPIQKITKNEYEHVLSEFPKLNWQNFHFYEHNIDEQNIVAECVGGQCSVGS